MDGTSDQLTKLRRVGVIGVGAIGAALVEALLTGPRAGQIEVVLSPRSAVRAAALADRFDRVRVADDNQGVVDDSDVVVLAVLPAQVREVGAALTFRADQVVIGLAAGWPPSLLTPVVAPASHVTQLIPLPVIALHAGPVVLHPASPAVEWLLKGCGELVVLEQERDIIVLSCASATMSSFFELQKTVLGWMTDRGLPPTLSRDYLSALFGGLATEAASVPVERLVDFPVEHETPGGLNEQVRLALTRTGTFDELRRELDALHRDRMQKMPG